MSRKKNNTKWMKVTTRVVGMDPVTFQESWRFKISRLQLLSLFFLILFIFFILYFILFSYTPLGQVLPENIKNRNKEKIESTMIQIDNLEQQVVLQDEYIRNLQNVILGNISIDSVFSKRELVYESNVLAPDTSLSLAEKQLEKQVNLNTQFNNVSKTNRLNDIFLFDPINGAISQDFDEKKHLGVDVITKPNETIKACLEGVVLHTSYDDKYGFTIVINHQNDITSVYKHLQKVLVKTGEIVKTGESIGIVGNTGESSTGPHLHFELWSNLGALDPLDYLSFGQ